MATLRIPFIDNGGEKSNMQMYVGDAIGDAAITAIFSAVQGITVGGEQKSVLVTEEDKDAGTLGAAASQLAQREVKLSLRGTDQVNGKTVTAEIPCFDLTTLPTGLEELDLSAGVGLALKTAVDAEWLSIDGNAVVLEEAVFITRKT